MLKTKLKLRELATRVTRAGLTQVQSVRFDKASSPPHINAGEGWTKDRALHWLQEHDLDDIEGTESDDTHFRAKRYDAGLFIDTKELDTGVVIIRCEKRSS
jgi:hypothetical protein